VPGRHDATVALTSRPPQKSTLIRTESLSTVKLFQEFLAANLYRSALTTRFLAAGHLEAGALDEFLSAARPGGEKKQKPRLVTEAVILRHVAGLSSQVGYSANCT